MKSLKKELIKVVIVIAILNCFGIIGSVYLQRKITNLSSNSKIQTYEEDMPGMESYISDGSSNQDNYTTYNYSDEEGVYMVTSSSDDEGETVEVITYDTLERRLMFPYLFYFLIVICSIIYGFIKVNSIIKNVVKFKNTTEESLGSLEENKKEIKYKELAQINDIVNESILEIKKSRRLEKELINFAMHDIKTPLQVIKGYGELIVLEEEKYGEEILKQVKILNSIIVDRLEDLQFKEENITFVLERIVKDYIFAYKNITFEFEKEKEIYWDINLSTFRRILTNLLDNSIKELGEKRKIEITQAKDLIMIRDYGSGINQKEFEELALNTKGTGLKIIKKYLKLNHLNLNVIKKEDGTLFIITNKTLYEDEESINKEEN